MVSRKHSDARPPVDEDFSIAAGHKIAPESFQFGARFRMVVNFAIKSNSAQRWRTSLSPKAPFQ
jgi:hypothetical protein